MGNRLLLSKSLQTFFYISFSISIAFGVIFNLGIESIYAIYILAFAIILTLIDNELAILTIALMSIFDRNYIIFGEFARNYLFSFWVIKCLVTRKKSVDFSASNFLFVIPIFLALINRTLLSILFGDQVARSFRDFFRFSVTFLTAFFIVITEEDIKRKNTVIRNLTALVGITTIFIFYAKYSTPFSRSLHLTSVFFNLPSDVYERIDPNFLSANLIIFGSLLMSDSKVLRGVFIFIFMLWNLLYGLSVTGFALGATWIVLMILKELSHIKRIFVLAFIILCTSILIEPVLSFFYSFKAIPTFSKYGFLDLITSGRFSIWIAYLELIKNYPLGTGSMDWRLVYKYLGSQMYAHNTFLQVIAECGLIFGGYIIFTIVLGIYRIRKTQRKFETSLYFLLASFVLSYYFEHLFAMIAMIYLMKSSLKNRRFTMAKYAHKSVYKSWPIK